MYELRVSCDRCSASEVQRLVALPKSDQMLPPGWGLVAAKHHACPKCADALGPLADIQRAPARRRVAL